MGLDLDSALPLNSCVTSENNSKAVSLLKNWDNDIIHLTWLLGRLNELMYVMCLETHTPALAILEKKTL